MLQNYFKIGLRALAKNRLSSSMNIFGLGLAVGCCLVMFEFLDWTMHLDSFHVKINQLFIVERVSAANGNQQLYGNSPAPGFLGFPLAYWVTSTLFSQISPESTVSLFPLILSFLVLVSMTLMSVSWHLFKVYTANSTKYLKEE